MNDIECIRHDDKAASRLAPQSGDGRFDLFVAMNERNGTTLRDRAAVSNEGIKVDAGVVSGLNMIATRLSPGAIPESRSSHLPAIEAS